MIRKRFLPVLIKINIIVDDISEEEAALFCSPLCSAGLALTNPVKTTKYSFETSNIGNKKLSTTIIRRENILLKQHYMTLEETGKKFKFELSIRDHKF